MKRVFPLFLAVLLLLTACGKAKPAETTQPPSMEAATTVPTVPSTQYGIPQDLPGVWVSADEGKLAMSETITFYENGELEVFAVYRGEKTATIYGTYRVQFNTIFCDITDGTEPFSVTYSFRVDGRELTLTDDDGDAHYLRTS